MNDELKPYSVVILDEAVHMLSSHVRFVANVSIPAARKLSATLAHAVKSLEAMPQRCPVYRTRGTVNTYRRLIIGRYQIIFFINEEDHTVCIQHILDSRQDNDI